MNVRLIFPLLFVVLLTGAFVLTRRKSPQWDRVHRFTHARDSFMLAPPSYWYRWFVTRDSNGIFHSIIDKPLTADDTLPRPVNAHVLFERTGDYGWSTIYDVIYVQKRSNDTLAIVIPQGDGEYFADYVIKVKDQRHRDSCEPGYPRAAEDYERYHIHFRTTHQYLQLDKPRYDIGDSIRGYVEGGFDIWESAGVNDTAWIGHIRMKGTFKTKVLCDTCDVF